MRVVAISLLLAFVAMAQDPRPEPLVGVFEGPGVRLELAGKAGDYSGTLFVQGEALRVIAKGTAQRAKGTFEASGQNFPFAIEPTADGVAIVSDGAEYRLTRKGGPMIMPPPQPPATSNLVGKWRNAQGYAVFNADGTGEVDGNPGRYEIRGNQLTMIGATGTATLPFQVQGDTLMLVVVGQMVVMQRERPQAAGAPGTSGVRPELVGKWCWITVTTANQEQRQSSRCITLRPEGEYLYEGLTDSFNPNGSATGQQSDAGTWEATDNTLTAHSRTGKTVTYRLEKRNHPKNVNDPMIVLDGQTFVTVLKKAPW